VIEDDDQLWRELSCLPSVEPEEEWEARVRTRCHAIIRKHAGSRQRRWDARIGPRLHELAAVAVLCLYFVVMLTQAARLRFH
jgi:hypothetical protein